MLRVSLFVFLVLNSQFVFAQNCDNVSNFLATVESTCTNYNLDRCLNSQNPTVDFQGYNQIEWSNNLDPDFYMPRCHVISCDGLPDPDGDKAFNNIIRIPISCIPSGGDTTLNAPVANATKFSNPRIKCASIIKTSNQVVGEEIPLVGVPFSLTYFTDRSKGKLSDYQVKFSLPNGNFDLSTITVDGDYLSIDDLKNNLSIYTWDGKSDGEEIWGGKKLTINQHFERFGANRLMSANNLMPSSLPIIPPTVFTLDGFPLGSSQPIVLESSTTIPAGNLKAHKLGLGGWLPSIWHFYDANLEKLVMGNGDSRDVKAVQEGAFKRVASSDGSEVYYFDSIGRIAQTRTGLTGAILFTFQYDAISQKLISITDIHKKKTRFLYDSNGNIFKIVSPENVITNVSVDGSGFLSSVKNQKNELYNLTYIDNGLLKTFTKPDGVVTTFDYSTDGHLISDSSSNGSKFVLSKTNNNVTAQTAMGRISQSILDINEKTEQEISPSGFATSYVHSESEDAASNALNNFSAKFVDDQRFGKQSKNYRSLDITNFGNSQYQIEETFNLNDSTNLFSINSSQVNISEGRSHYQIAYDGLTRTNTLTTAGGRTLIVQIDSLERPIVNQVGQNTPVRYVYQNELMTKIAQGNRTLDFSYGANKLVSSIKNALNQEVKFSYDEAQRLNAKTLPDGRVISFIYDSNDNLVSITPPGRPVHNFTYGGNEKIKTYTPPSLENVQNVTSFYTYNLDKQLTKITNPNGSTINFNYDATSGLMNSLVATGLGTYSYEYENDLVKKISNQRGQSAELGHIGNVVSYLKIVENNNNTLYEFERVPSTEASQKVGVENLSVKNVNQSLQYHYDDDKLLTGAGELSLSYDSPNGNLISTSLDNVKESFSYTSFGELKSYKATIVLNGVEKTLYSYNLKRDVLGRIESKDEKLSNKKENQYNFDYKYDTAGRLIKTTIKTGKATYNNLYAYDSNSNRIGQNIDGEAVDSVYDNQDRLLRYKNTRYSYNPNGSLIQISRLVDQGYQNVNVVYDIFGSLRTIGNVNYRTDIFNRRNARFVNGVMTHQYAYNPEGQLIAELDGQGNLKKRFVYASKAHVPDYFVDENNNRFKLIVDHLGSLRLVVNSATGEIVEEMFHNEFGDVVTDTNPSFVPFGFAGGIYDPETRLVRFGARDYDSEVGRWTSKDPIRFSAGDSNVYGYVFNDPINGLDPNGLWTVQIGINFSGTLFGANGNYNAGVALDSNGNVTTYNSYSLGAGYGAGVNFSGTLQFSNACQVKDLAGPFNTVSVGGGAGIAGSIDQFNGTTSSGEAINGAGISVGPGVGVSGSVNNGPTFLGPIYKIY